MRFVPENFTQKTLSRRLPTLLLVPILGSFTALGGSCVLASPDALQGMVSGLEPHSGYLSSKAYQELTAETGEEFGGLGIEVGMESGVTPSCRHGMKALRSE